MRRTDIEVSLAEIPGLGVPVMDLHTEYMVTDSLVHERALQIFILSLMTALNT